MSVSVAMSRTQDSSFGVRRDDRRTLRPGSGPQPGVVGGVPSVDAIGKRPGEPRVLRLSARSVAGRGRRSIGWPLRFLHFCTLLLIGSSCVTAEPDAVPIPDGSYGVDSNCSQAAAPDVDMIVIHGQSISDIESTCEIGRIRKQADGIILFEAQCRNDVNPRTSDGFLYRLDDNTIMLDYGYGPAIWHACAMQ